MMKKTLLAAIIAATALVPPAALAQDRGGRWQNRERAQSNDDGAQAGPTRGSWRGEGGQRPQPQPQAEQAQPQPQPDRRDRGDRGPRGDGQVRTWNRGDGGWRRQQPTPQAQVEAQVQPAEQTRQSRQWRGNRGGQWNNGQQTQQAQPAQQSQHWRGDRNGDGVSRNHRDWNDRNGANNNRGWNDRNGWNNNRGAWNNNRNNSSRWNNGWRNDNHYDWRGYRNTNRSHYRLPRYYAPSNWGYGYRRFSIGYTLSSILFGSQYWISDPYNYRLPDVYGPYRWVRYYNDALLVDIYTGEVVDTVYDIFW